MLESARALEGTTSTGISGMAVSMSQGRILIVEDEAIVREVVERYLTREGYDVHSAADGETALRLAQQVTPDLVVLDLMLPKLDGLEVTRRLHAASRVPIIMLTAKGEETDKILGLGLGADDYLVKPFSPRELVARVQAVMRRVQGSGSQASDVGGTRTFADLAIDPRSRNVWVQGRMIELTPKEFDLLAYLSESPNQVFTREQILSKVWDYAYDGDSSTVTVHMRRLREKIEPDPVHPTHLKTVWGVGYKFEP